MGLLDTAGGGCRLAGGLGGELLARRLASGGLPGGLLGAGHDCYVDARTTDEDELCAPRRRQPVFVGCARLAAGGARARARRRLVGRFGARSAAPIGRRVGEPPGYKYRCAAAGKHSS